jgi:hypothetical protein
MQAVEVREVARILAMCQLVDLVVVEMEVQAALLFLLVVLLIEAEAVEEDFLILILGLLVVLALLLLRFQRLRFFLRRFWFVGIVGYFDKT